MTDLRPTSTATRTNEPALPHADPFTHGDGYEYMDTAQAHGWETIALWGDDGYDFGAWPLVIGFYRQGGTAEAPRYGYGLYIEGDLKTTYHDTPDALAEAISRDAHFFWRNGDSMGPEDLPEKFEDVPAKYRRP